MIELRLLAKRMKVDMNSAKASLNNAGKRPLILIAMIDQHMFKASTGANSVIDDKKFNDIVFFCHRYYWLIIAVISSVQLIYRLISKV